MNTTAKNRFANAAKETVQEDDLRPAMRDDDPRAAAAKRAAELRSHQE